MTEAERIAVILRDAATCKNRQEFRTKFATHRSWLQRHKLTHLLDDVLPARRSWTVETAAAALKPYSTRTEAQRAQNGAYRYLAKRGLLDAVLPVTKSLGRPVGVKETKPRQYRGGRAYEAPPANDLWRDAYAIRDRAREERAKEDLLGDGPILGEIARGQINKQAKRHCAACGNYVPPSAIGHYGGDEYCGSEDCLNALKRWARFIQGKRYA